MRAPRENPYASPRVVDGPPFQPAVVTDRPSFILRGAGCICAPLCVLFGLTTIVGLVRLQFPVAIGGVVVTAVTGSVAWAWTGKRRFRNQTTAGSILWGLLLFVLGIVVCVAIPAVILALV